jgi:hypothetical protein
VSLPLFFWEIRALRGTTESCQSGKDFDRKSWNVWYNVVPGAIRRVCTG